MDYPEGARVLNISVDLGVHGRDDRPRPPIETRLRVITEPILRLTSIDLNACKDVDSLEELFNFGNDYLGLVKAGVIASGLIPPALEGTHDPARRAAGDGSSGRGYGLEIVSKVNDIPKGSRLAVSTNLLASLITPPDARDRPGAEPDRPARPRGGQGRRGPGDPGRMAGRLGRRLARLGGIFPGVKLIEGVAGRRGRPRVGRQPGPPAAGPRACSNAPPARSRRVGRADPFHEAWPRAWSWSTAGWRRTSGRSSTWSPSNTCCASRDEWQRRQEALEIFDEIVWRRSSVGRPRPRRLDDPELGRPAQADHPLGEQRVHRVDHPRGQGRPSATTSGAS